MAHSKNVQIDRLQIDPMRQQIVYQRIGPIFVPGENAAKKGLPPGLHRRLGIRSSRCGQQRRSCEATANAVRACEAKQTWSALEFGRAGPPSSHADAAGVPRPEVQWSSRRDAPGARSDDSLLAHTRQMVGDVRLFQSGRRNKFADGFLPQSQVFQNGPARRFRQSLRRALRIAMSVLIPASLLTFCRIIIRRRFDTIS